MERQVSTLSEGRTNYLVHSGSKINKGTRDGVYGYGTRQLYTTLIQAEMYAIKACIVENLEWNYRNRNICILSDNHIAVKALDKYQIN